VPVASQLFKVASSNGAAALGLNAGEIAAGQLADFATLDLDNAELFGWTEETLLESFIFGASGPAAVAETCVGGHWRVAKVDMDFSAGSAAAAAADTPEARL
jgi:cytosine/adenosine deaminase-related metal-dependent hydrolase